MAIIHKCDLCRKEFPLDHALNVVSLFPVSLNNGFKVLNGAEKRYELCDICYKAIKADFSYLCEGVITDGKRE